MNNDDVIVRYKKFDNNHPIISDISFELIQDVILKLIVNDEDGTINICMKDAISDNLELEGQLDYQKVVTLIKALSQLRIQIA